MTRRNGFTILELAVATLMLGVLMVVTMQFFSAMMNCRQAAEQQRTALREAGNIMERLAARPWDRLTPEAVRDVQLSEEARQRLPAAKLTIELTQPEKEPDAKQIAVQVHWQDRPEQPQRPVRVVAWKHRKSAPRENK